MFCIHLLFLFYLAVVIISFVFYRLHTQTHTLCCSMFMSLCFFVFLSSCCCLVKYPRVSRCSCVSSFYSSLNKISYFTIMLIFLIYFLFFSLISSLICTLLLIKFFFSEKVYQIFVFAILVAASFRTNRRVDRHRYKKKRKNKTE